MIRYIDIHSHFLPGIDDGCRTVRESIRVLRASSRQKVAAMAATPHYYSKEPVEAFVAKRQEAYERLCEALAEDQGIYRVPEICLGAEVAYRAGISREDDLHQLCYGRSKYLLLEMPFSKWRPEVLKETEYMIHSRNIIPVIAHIERYAHFQSRETLEQLYDMDVLIQMNAEYYQGFLNIRRARKQIRDGAVQVLGSDAHNMTDRPPNLGKTADRMIADGLRREVGEMMNLAKEIFSDAVN